MDDHDPGDEHHDLKSQIGPRISIGESEAQFRDRVRMYWTDPHPSAPLEARMREFVPPPRAAPDSFAQIFPKPAMLTRWATPEELSLVFPRPARSGR